MHDSHCRIPECRQIFLIRHVSSAVPQVASYPFTTKGIIVGHRSVGRERIQFVDTPGILDRPAEERNAIEKQALSAMIHIADIILFILDPSEHCGYPLEVRLNLLEEVKGCIDVPLVIVSNKSDITAAEGYLTMSTQTGEGVDEVLAEILSHKPEPPARVRFTVPDIRSPLPHKPEERVMDEFPYPEEEGRHKSKPKPRRARKPRSIVSQDS